METWRQTNFYRWMLPTTVQPTTEDYEVIAPPQLWNLLSPTQQQQVLQTLIQVSLELVHAVKTEEHNESS